jgi:hypothetical protein
MNPVVEKIESGQETQNCNNIVQNDQRPAVGQYMEIHAKGNDENVREGGLGSRVGREMGYGDFCFGRLLGTDRQTPYPLVEKTGQLEWSYEDFQLGSGNARSKEIGHFERYYA